MTFSLRIKLLGDVDNQFVEGWNLVKNNKDAHYLDTKFTMWFIWLIDPMYDHASYWREVMMVKDHKDDYKRHCSRASCFFLGPERTMDELVWMTRKTMSERFYVMVVMRYFRWPPQWVLILALLKNGNAIKYMRNPSVEEQLAAVYGDPDAIEYIREPAPEVQIEAVAQKPSVIALIDKPIMDIVEYSLMGKSVRQYVPPKGIDEYRMDLFLNEKCMKVQLSVRRPYTQ